MYCVAAQLQRYEDTAPDSLEFERLKDHFEPYLQHRNTSSLSSSTLTTQPSRTSVVTAAASAALARDIPGVGKWRGGRVGGRSEGKDKSVNKDEMVEYKSRVEVGVQGQDGDRDAQFIKHVEEVGEVAGLEQRWANSWKTSLQTRFVAPPSPLPSI